MTDFAIEIAGLTKIFRAKGADPVTAVAEVTLKVKQGEIYGFLGPNGAGKTTTVRCALGILPFDQGQIKLLGKTPAGRKETFKKVGFCPDTFCLPDELTPMEHLLFGSRLHGADTSESQIQADKWLEKLDLKESADRPCAQLSLGTKQRLSIAQALVHEPKLVLLDEPTSGLDPIAQGRLVELLSDLAKGGTTIFFNSHQLSQVEKICDRVGILNKGQLVREDTLDSLTEAGGVEQFFIEVVKGQ